MKLLITLVVALTIASGASAATSNHKSDTLATMNALASSVARKPVTAICENPTEWAADPVAQGFGTSIDAYSIPGSTSVTLSPLTCGTVLMTIQDPRGVSPFAPTYPTRLRQTEAEGWAIERLLHEASHAKGIVDETDADCNALASLPQALNDIGVPAARATQMLRYAEALHSFLPPAYHSHPCSA
jgi:hypothetical protein